MSIVPDLAVSSDAPHERRLRALAAISRSVAGAYELAEVLEVAAEQTRAVLGVSQLSISRWELEQGCLRTLINVGDLSDGEERWPTDELYPLDEYPKAHAVLELGEPHVTSRGHYDADRAELELLEQLGKETCAAVPIVFEQQTWGELWAATAPGLPALAGDDIGFMQAVCSQIALAIGRAELFTRLVEAAYRDELTGVANRRAFDERLEAALRHDHPGPAVVLLGDVDGLKDINDTEGHAAGDAALRTVGKVLRAECGRERLAARIGGDEFGIILEGSSQDAGERLARILTARLSREDPPVSVSWGVAVQVSAATSASELLRAADLAHYDVKRRRRSPGARSATKRRRVRDDVSVSDAVFVLALMRDGLAVLDASENGEAEAGLERFLGERLGPDPDRGRCEATADAVRLLRRAATGSG